MSGFLFFLLSACCCSSIVFLTFSGNIQLLLLFLLRSTIVKGTGWKYTNYIITGILCPIFISTENLFLIVRKCIWGVNTKMLLLNLNQNYAFSFCKKRITYFIIFFFINWTCLMDFSYLFSFYFSSLRGRAIMMNCSSLTFLLSAQTILLWYVGLLWLSWLGSVLQ